MDAKYYTTVEGTITMNDVAKLLVTTRTHILHLMREGRIKGINIMREGAKKNVWRFKAEDIKKLIDQV